jgi:hypothetical protein
MASRFDNNYCGKTDILSITFATREQYSQILRDIYITISDAKKLSTLWCRGNSPEWTDSTAASVVSQRLIHLFTQYEYTILWKLKHCVPNNGKISHVTWKIRFLVKHCSLTDVPFWYENGGRVIKCSPQIDEVSGFTENHSLGLDMVLSEAL